MASVKSLMGLAKPHRPGALSVFVPFHGYARSGRQVEDYKSCLRVKGYTLDILELNEAGDWVKR